MKKYKYNIKYSQNYYTYLQRKSEEIMKNGIHGENNTIRQLSVIEDILPELRHIARLFGGKMEKKATSFKFNKFTDYNVKELQLIADIFGFNNAQMLRMVNFIYMVHKLKCPVCDKRLKLKNAILYREKILIHKNCKGEASDLGIEAKKRRRNIAETSAREWNSYTFTCPECGKKFDGKVPRIGQPFSCLHCGASGAAEEFKPKER
jgi:ribosomal protein L37AE/L43A